MYKDFEGYVKYLNKNIKIFTEELGYNSFPINVLNDQLNFKKIENQFLTNGFCIIDDFLKPEYCERLRKFTLMYNVKEDIYDSYAAINFSKNGKQIWFRLLSNISDEIKQNFNFLKNLNYIRGWSFIHENLQKISVGKHFDPDSLITFNLWCTPNECSYVDENYNGFIIYDTFKLSEVENSKKNIIQYKYNRAVVFDSRKIHESLCSKFKKGYENRKINYTFLYK
jgi:hypothetical protein